MVAAKKGRGSRSKSRAFSDPDPAVEAASKRGYATRGEREALLHDVEKEIQRQTQKQKARGAAVRNGKVSKQTENLRHGLQDGPPPAKGPGMAIARQQHHEAMANDRGAARNAQLTRKVRETVAQKSRPKQGLTRSR